MALPIKTSKAFGAALRDARKKEGLTQRELALSAGTGERFIVDLENGKETVRLGKALHVALCLGLTIALTRRG